MAKQKTENNLVRTSIPLDTTQFADPEKVVVKRWANGEYRQNPVDKKGKTSTSTHIMSDLEFDGKFYAAPTLYPKDRKGTISHDPKDWWEAPPTGKAVVDTAIARGELYGPFKSPKIASKFAENGYKNMPAQKIASGKLLKKK
jgi:hypothetical protein